jgi:hypothetical protein
MTQVQTYRFKYSEEFTEPLSYFAKIHQYDDRHIFKEAWTEWTQENAQLIAIETERLITLQYKGDILDKMFKSARYYYRKKQDPLLKKLDEDEKKPNADTNKLRGFSHNMLTKMDEHIMKQINSHINPNTVVSTISPADAYSDFCQTHGQIIADEIRRFIEPNKKLDSEKISNKFKKTYKNRFYISTH